MNTFFADFTDNSVEIDPPSAASPATRVHDNIIISSGIEVAGGSGINGALIIKNIPDTDPYLTQVLASTSGITTYDDEYRCDFPSISSYRGCFSNTNSTTNIASGILALVEVVNGLTFGSNITGGLSVDTITLPTIGDMETAIQGK